MTKEDAIGLASEYVTANDIVVEKFESARFLTFPTCEESTLRPDDLETYLSVKSKWRDHWVVSFRKIIPPNCVENPATELICVYENGEVVHRHSM